MIIPNQKQTDTATATLMGHSMSGKPVLERTNTRTVLTSKNLAFQEKALCDGITLNLGDACVFNCSFCYVPQQMRKLLKPIIDAHNELNHSHLNHQDVIVRRADPLQVLKNQLLDARGNPRFNDPSDNRVVYSSTLVDVGANMELLRETAEACTLILDQTHWQIRLLSKGSLLPLLVKREMIPNRQKAGNARSHHQRIILGFSTGTLDDKLAAAFEKGTARVSKRLEALYWLQDHGYRTFAMICPSLPQSDYVSWSRQMCAALRVERCEHVWAEVINVRGDSFRRTHKALIEAGFEKEAALLASVSEGISVKANWEAYARQTFEAHTLHVPASKLRFLQYIDKHSAAYWKAQGDKGALLLGSCAQELGLAKIVASAPGDFYQSV